MITQEFQKKSQLPKFIIPQTADAEIKIEKSSLKYLPKHPGSKIITISNQLLHFPDKC